MTVKELLDIYSDGGMGVITIVPSGGIPDTSARRHCFDFVYVELCEILNLPILDLTIEEKRFKDTKLMRESNNANSYVCSRFNPSFEGVPNSFSELLNMEVESLYNTWLRGMPCLYIAVKGCKFSFRDERC